MPLAPQTIGSFQGFFETTSPLRRLAGCPIANERSPRRFIVANLSRSRRCSLTL